MKRKACIYFAQSEAGSPTSEMENIFAKPFKGLIT